MNIFQLSFHVWKKDDDFEGRKDFPLSFNGEYYYHVSWCANEVKFDPPLDITDNPQSLDDAKMKILRAASFDGFKGNFNTSKE